MKLRRFSMCGVAVSAGVLCCRVARSGTQARVPRQTAKQIYGNGRVSQLWGGLMGARQKEEPERLGKPAGKVQVGGGVCMQHGSRMLLVVTEVHSGWTQLQ